MSAAKTASDRQENRDSSGFFRGNIAVIAFSNAIRLVGSFAGVFVPLYFVQIGGNALTLGLLASASSIVQFFILAIGGFIADFYGRRRILVFAAFYSVFFPLLYAVVRDWRVFGVLTLLSALGSIASPAVHATIADSIPPKDRTIGIANLQVVSSLPSALSPTLGGWLIQTYGLEEGFKLGCVCAAVFTFISALPLFTALKETLATKDTERVDPPLWNAFSDLARISLFQLPSSIRFLFVSYGLVVFANAAVAQYYILYASGVAGLSALDWGAVVSLQFLLASVLKIPGGWLSERFGKRRTMIISLLFTVPMILLFTMSRSLIQVIATALLLVAAGIYYAPAHEALQADLTTRSMRGRVTALWDMGNAVSAAAGGLIGGLTFQFVGPAVPFYVFAVAELIAAILLIMTVKEPEQREP